MIFIAHAQWDSGTWLANVEDIPALVCKTRNIGSSRRDHPRRGVQSLVRQSVERVWASCRQRLARRPASARTVAPINRLAAVFSGLLVAAVPGAGRADGSPSFNWNVYHAQNDACLERDRIAALCIRHGVCDRLALQRAQRACSSISADSQGTTTGDKR